MAREVVDGAKEVVVKIVVDVVLVSTLVVNGVDKGAAVVLDE